jgi:hypothetical protein
MNRTSVIAASLVVLSLSASVPLNPVGTILPFIIK